MANNRIYLKCNVCGETLFLGKSFLNGYYWENYGKLNGDPDSPPLEDRLNEFFEKHTYCNGEGNDGDYSIEYESSFRDTVEVVRCGKCRHYLGNHDVPGCAPCDFWDIGGVMWDDFCKRGERYDSD